jgi:hypothetical protein
MVLGSPVKRPARRAQAVPAAGLAVAVAATAMLLLLLLSAAALRCSPAFGCALSAGTLWAGGVSVAAEAASASAGNSDDNDDEEEQCDLFDGEWAWADDGGGYPLYSSADCPFLDVGFRCAENGRPDASYTRWRWQPSRCHLPRLVACSLASIRFVSPLLASTLCRLRVAAPLPFP